MWGKGGVPALAGTPDAGHRHLHSCCIRPRLGTRMGPPSSPDLELCLHPPRAEVVCPDAPHPGAPLLSRTDGDEQRTLGCTIAFGSCISAARRPARRGPASLGSRPSRSGVESIPRRVRITESAPDRWSVGGRRAQSAAPRATRRRRRGRGGPCGGGWRRAPRWDCGVERGAWVRGGAARVRPAPPQESCLQPFVVPCARYR